MLSLVNNLAALTAENNLSNANSSLNTSLQRLSSGLQINSGADNPAGLVISQEQQAQMSGLQAAITNTSNATNVVQTADGALNETNSLLLQIRGLVVSAANSGANDANTLAANQAQIANALQTISSIATSTQYGNNQLLNGSHAVTASVQQSDLASVLTSGTTATGAVSASVTGSVPSGTYTANITSLGAAATVSGTAVDTATAATATGGAINPQAVAAASTGTVLTQATAASSLGTALTQATAASFTGGTVTPSGGDVLASGATETVTIGGHDITVGSATAASTGTDVQNQINADSATTGVTAAWDSTNNDFTFTSNSTGTASNGVTISESGGTALAIGSGATLLGGTSGNVLDAGQSETLTINDHAISLSGGTTGLTDAQAVQAINDQSNATGVSAAFDSTTNKITLTSTAAGTAGNAYSVSETAISGTGTGTGVGFATGSPTFNGGTAGNVLDAGQTETLTINGHGINLSGGSTGLTDAQAVQDINALSTTTGVSAAFDNTTNKITLASTTGGTAGNAYTVSESSITGSGHGTGVGFATGSPTFTGGTTGNVLDAGQSETLTINGHAVNLSGGVNGLTDAGAVSAINAQSSTTGATASFNSTTNKITFTSTTSGAGGNADTVTEGSITGTGTGTGLGVGSSTTFSGGTSSGASTNVLDAGQTETLTINGTAISLSGGTTGLTDAAAVTTINAQSKTTGVTAAFDSTNNTFTLASSTAGTAANAYTVSESAITGTGNGTGLGLSDATKLANGADVAGTITGPDGTQVTGTGVGNVLTGDGLSITTDPTGTTGTIALNVQGGNSSATATVDTASGTYTSSITQLARQATLEGGTDLTGKDVVGANETDLLTVNGVQIQLNGGTTGLNADGAASAINQYSNQTGVTASVDTTAGAEKLKLTSTAYGSAQNISVQESGVTNPGSPNSAIAGVGTGGLAGATLTAGQNVEGTIKDGSGNSYEATGTGNVLTAANGLAITTNPNATTSGNPVSASNPETLTTVVSNNAMQFQIGADAGQTASVAISNMQSNAIGTGVTNSSGIVNLSQIDVTNSSQSSADILSVVDQAISQVSNLAGNLGSFQDNTLQATATNLQSSLQNTTAANSTIRDTDFATESATYAQNQVLVQAGTQVLKNANQLPQLVLTLLQ